MMSRVRLQDYPDEPPEEPGIASPEFLRLHGYGISESISGEMPSVAVGPEILLGHGKGHRLHEFEKKCYLRFLSHRSNSVSRCNEFMYFNE